MRLRLIGDVHGDPGAILGLHSDYWEYDLNIQLGDWGAGFGAEMYLDMFHAPIFRVLHGNHDNPASLALYPHDLGRFGLLELEDCNIFYFAGAYSIDREHRTPGLNWWYDEQLNSVEAEECIQLWEKVCDRVDLVISHDCPINIGYQLLKEWPIESMTGNLGYAIWKHHQPPLWRFGHHHRPWIYKLQNTEFRCLNINEEEVLEFPRV